MLDRPNSDIPCNKHLPVDCNSSSACHGISICQSEGRREKKWIQLGIHNSPCLVVHIDWHGLNRLGYASPEVDDYGPVDCSIVDECMSDFKFKALNNSYNAHMDITGIWMTGLVHSAYRSPSCDGVSWVCYLQMINVRYPTAYESHQVSYYLSSSDDIMGIMIMQF